MSIGEATRSALMLSTYVLGGFAVGVLATIAARRVLGC